jgi:DeoR/GlpR family transcriptional regulator of sugar metabolism
MFGIERRNMIMSLLNEKKSILVQEAAALYLVTEETIRRDLKILEQQGHIIRTHGGAILPEDSHTEPSLEIRQGINTAGKDAIGKTAAAMVEDGDTIILDASTSSLYVAKHIKVKRGITVITNAQRVVQELSDCEEITVISTGGSLRRQSMSFVGHSAEISLGGYFANKVFLSTKGFSPFQGLSDSNEAESMVRKKMIERSKKVVYLCDHTKFDQVGYITTAGLSELDMIITDVTLPEEWTEEMKKYDLKIILTEQA